MDNQNQNTDVPVAGDNSGQIPISSSFGVIPEPDNPEALSLDPSTLEPEQIGKPPPLAKASPMMRLMKRADIALVLLLAVGMVGLFVRASTHKQQQAANSAATQYSTQQIPLNGFVATEQGLSLGTSTVVINGSLKLNDGLVVAPSVQPNAPKAGQLYYDQNTNQLAYYNGTQFVPLTANSPAAVQSLGGLTGQITLGGGLTTVGNQLISVNNGVTSVSGQSGALTLGSGLSMAGKVIQNSGVLSVTAGTPNLIVDTDGNGNLTISSVGAGTGTVSSGGGTAGQLAVFTGSQTIGDSLVSQSGGAVAVTGNLNVSGSLSLGAPLNVTDGGTGVASLAANGVIVGGGAGALTSVVAGSAGLCLISTAGAPNWVPCPGGGGVSSVNGLSGALTIANATGSVNTITINDAGVGTKGIASFDGTNFSVAGGAVNTIQNISPTSSPSFAGVNTNTITPSADLTIVGSANLTVQGGTATLGTLAQSGTLALSDGSSNTVSIVTAGLSADRVYTLPDAGGNATLCVDSGNCLGGSGGAPNIANYLVTSLNGTLTNERALASGANIALTDGGANSSFTVATVQNPTFTTSVTTPQLQSSGALTITSAAGTTVAVNAGTTIELQDSTNVTGSLAVSVALNVGAGNAFQVNSSGAITAATGIVSSGAITFSGLNCTTFANGGALTTDASGNLTCSDDDGGAGGAISGSGSAGSIPLFTGAQTIANSIITQSGSTITVTGSLALTNALTVANGGTGATSFTSNGVLYGNAAGALQVSAAGTSGQVLVANGSGVPTFVSFSGDVAVSNAGVTTVQPDAVALGTDTTGSYVANLGALTGLTTSGNSGEGSTPTLSVTYGAIANTAVQGNVTLTCPAGIGNLSGGGNSVTLGAGGSCNNISIANNPTFSTSVTTPSMILTGAGSNGTVQVGTLGQSTIYTLPDPGAGAAAICISTGNCSAAGGAGGDLTGSYPNPTIAKLQGTNLTISAPNAGHILVYNGTAGAWENQAVTGDIGISETGVATVQANAVALGTDTTGNYVLGLTAGTGVNVTGSAGEGWSPTVSVAYGSAAGTAVQGNTSISVSAGTNLTGGGSITLGAGGTVTLNVASSPVFSGTLAVQGTTVTVGTAAQQGSLVLNDGATKKGTLQTAALGQDTTYTLPDPGVGSASICLTTGNCAGSGSGVTTTGGTINRVSKFTGAQALGDSTISDNGSVVTINGTANFVVQGGTGTFGTLTQAGTLAVSDGSSNTVSIVAAGLSADRTYTLPDAGGAADFCLSTGNCLGGGGGGAPNNATYLVTSLDGTLSNERAVTNGSNISLTDGGANGSFTVATVQNPTFTTSVTTPQLQSSGALTVTSAAGTTVAVNAGTTIELQDDTNVTGSLDVSVALNVGTANAFQVSSGGAITAATGLASSGTITFSGLNCTTFTNGGALTTDVSGNLTCSNDDGGSASAITGSGTSGTIPVFNGTQTITNSIITQSGTSITIAGDLTLNTALTVANGGTGAASFTSHGVLYGNAAGAIQVTSAGTGGQVLIANGSGVPTFATFSGDVAVSNTGVTTIQADAVALGTDTTGSYVANLGTLTGLTTTGNSGEGSTPTLSVTYGSIASTAVQGNTTLTCPAGTGNLSGGGNAITLGAGGSCSGITTVNNPTFTTSVTTPSLILTGAGSNGTLQVANLGQATAYTLPDPLGPTASICLSTGNCAAAGSAGGDLTGSYPNPTIAKLQSGTLTITSVAANNILEYNGSAWVNQSISGDVVLNSSAVATIQTGAVTSGKIADGTIANIDLSTGSFGNITGVGTLGSLTVVGATSLNASGTASTSIGNGTGTFQLTSPGLNVSTAGALTGVTGIANSGGYVQSGATANTLTGATSFTAAGTALSVTNDASIGGTLTVNTITPNSALIVGSTTQSFTLQGNATSTLTATDTGKKTTVGFETPTGNATINFPTLSGGPFQVCTSSGNCAGVGATLQTAYNNSTNPEITLDGTRGALTVRDSSGGIGANLLEVQNNGGTTTYFNVTTAGINTTGTNVSSGNVNTTGGTIQTNSTDRISNGGNLVNIGTVTTSGAINLQTISSSANFTGTMVIQGANALTLGTTGTSTGAVLFKGSTAASGTITLNLLTNNPGTHTLQLPNEDGTLCSTGSVCTGYQASGSYANTALSNLASVAINAALGFQSNQTGNVNFAAAAAAGGNTLNITGQTAGATANNGGQISIQGGTATTTGTGGLLQLLGGATTATGTNGGVTIDAGSGATAANGTILIGNTNTSSLTIAGTNATTVNIANTAPAAARTITLGGGNAGFVDLINIGTGNGTVAGAKTIHIGDGSPSGSGTNLITIGSVANVASTTTIQGGNGPGAIALTPQTTGAITIGAGAGTGNITLGSSSATQSVLIANGAGVSTVTIASGGTAGNTVNIATDATASAADIINIGTGNVTGTGTKTVNIANGTPGGSGSNSVNIGSLTGAASTTTIQGGTGNSAISLLTGTAGVISLGATTANLQTGASDVRIANNALSSNAQSVSIGSYSTSGVVANTTSIEGGNATNGGGYIHIGTAAAAHQIEIGNSASGDNDIVLGSTNTGSTVIVEAGTGVSALQIGNGATAHGIQIGSNASGANAILLGSANSSSVLSLEGGTGASGINIGNGATAHGIQIGSNASGANIIALGSANSGSAIAIEGGTGASGINIGNGNTVHGIQIGAGGTNTTQSVTIGSSSASSIVNLLSGAANISLTSNGATNGTVVKSSTNSTLAFQIQNSSNSSIMTADTVNRIITDNSDHNVGATAGSRLFTDSFEENSFSLWDQGLNGTAATVSTTQKRNGNYSAFFSPGASNSYYLAHMQSTTGYVYMRGYVYINARSGLANNFVNLFGFGLAGANINKSFDAEIQRSDGQLFIYDGSNAGTNHGTGATISSGVWHKIEFRATTAATTAIQVWLDDASVGSIVTDATTANFNQVIIGDDNAPGAGNSYYLDDISVDSVPTTVTENGALNVQDSFHVGGSSSLGQTIIQGASDSTIEFQVQNAAGSSLFNVDSVNQTVSLATSGSKLDLASGTNGNTAILKIPQKATNGTCNSAANEGLRIQNTGGTQVGHLCISGPTGGSPNQLTFFAQAFTPGSTDVAENYSDLHNNLQPGDLVALDGNASRAVTKATQSNASQLFGVISTAPGVLLSGINESDGSTNLVNPKPVALSGRIPTKVSTENGAIAPGDYLTISSTPGVAMKATAAGQVIGRALETYHGAGIGLIEVVAQNVYYPGPSVADTLQNGHFSDLVADGTITTANLKVTGLTTVADILVGGHIITAGAAPTATVLAAAGANAAVIVAGNDTAGTITIVAGSSATADDLAKITFNKAFGASPEVVLTPVGKASASLQIYVDNTTTTDFRIGAGAQPPVAGQTYTFNYHTIQ